MIEKYHLRPTINVTQFSQIKVITIKTVSQETTTLQMKAVSREIMEILQISRIIVTMVFITLITITKKVIQEIINNQRIILIPGEMSHTMKSIRNKILSGQFQNKLQNSIMSKKIDNAAVIPEVDNIIKTEITEQIVVILIDQDHQDSE